MTRYCFAVTILLVFCVCQAALTGEPKKYLRFQKSDKVAYGLLEGFRVRELSGDLFGAHSRTETTYGLSEIKLLPPTKPSQVLALAGNYRSHLKDDAVPPKFQIPQPFFKSPS